MNVLKGGKAFYLIEGKEILNMAYRGNGEIYINKLFLKIIY